MYIEEKRSKTKLTIRDEIALMSKNLSIIANDIENRNRQNDKCFTDISCKVQQLNENIHGNGKKGLLERTGILENTLHIVKWVIGIGFTAIGIGVSVFKIIK
jgi:hypothetical protein